MNVEQMLIEMISQFGAWAIVASFGIGLLTSLAPCSIITLPLLAGSALGLSKDLSAKQKKVFIYQYSLLFVLGLVISFSLLMLLVSKMGMMLSLAPFWAYLLAALATFTVVAYALGWIQGFDKETVARKFLRFKLLGAVIIGLIFGLVSTPCASAPLVAIITIASQSGWVYSYALVLAFALGHGMLLLVAGTSLGFTQSVVSSRKINKVSRVINGFFVVVLVGIGVYFLYQAYRVF
ncbi:MULTISPECIES: cytochrome c biogenesis protein CcdA [unclassified Sulfurospirillum]|uniref:cytochrome c biogenesis CcdA family protein n=1 Tax=unclassified Sulfurospirillum TaxID=2618290 RepID=UPI000507FCE8|nr:MULTISPECIES: cytochrome c biogenesis protein CcdA [unclassified Sulfurospirillum]KFL33125.1 cytochrome C biogenesis protein [Sulfurospirillum sp. SCADC]